MGLPEERQRDTQAGFDPETEARVLRAWAETSGGGPLRNPALPFRGGMRSAIHGDQAIRRGKVGGVAPVRPGPHGLQ